MKFSAAHVRIHDHQFMIALLKVESFENEQRRLYLNKIFERRFPGTDIVLMCEEPSGKQRFWGNKDIVHSLAAPSTDTSHLPWKLYEAGEEDTSKDGGLTEEIFVKVFVEVGKQVVARLLHIPPPPPWAG